MASIEAAENSLGTKMATPSFLHSAAQIRESGSTVENLLTQGDHRIYISHIEQGSVPKDEEKPREVKK